MFLNCGAVEDSWESLGHQGDQNQSTLKEINSINSAEGLMLKLKVQYFGHLMWIADSLEKTLILGKIEGRRKRGWQDEMVGWHHRFHWHELGQILGDGKWQGSLVCCCLWSHKETDNLATEQQQQFDTSCRIFLFLFCEKCLGILKETAENM